MITGMGLLGFIAGSPRLFYASWCRVQAAYYIYQPPPLPPNPPPPPPQHALLSTNLSYVLYRAFLRDPLKATTENVGPQIFQITDHPEKIISHLAGQIFDNYLLFLASPEAIDVMFVVSV